MGIKTSGKEAIVGEVKRQKRNYDHKSFMEKVERIKTSVLSNYEVETRLYTIDDM